VGGGFVLYGKKRTAQMTLLGKSEGKKPFANLDVDGRILLKCILKKQTEMVWTGFVYFW
jgi:hypothetical protein